jgi:hypothetical protein
MKETEREKNNGREMENESHGRSGRFRCGRKCNIELEGSQA